MNLRVNSFAKEIKITSKDLIKKLKALGVDVKGPTSLIDEKTVKIIRNGLAGKREKKKTQVAEKKEKPKAFEKKKKPEASGKIETPKEPEISEKPGVAEEKKPTERIEIKREEAPVKEPKPAQPESGVKEEKKDLKILEVELPMTVRQLATKLNARPNDIIKTMMNKGIFANLNQNLDNSVVIAFAKERGYEIKEALSLEDELLKEHKDLEKEGEKHGTVIRAPIVTLMGHVDHGKTSLLDYIRKTKVTAKEKGGITQHIGAYQVDIGKKGRVTFLDTPGHQAFTAMRARGANATDIVILVVAADDGIMPQTVEAIDHAKAANVPIVVAINKCDLPNISMDKIKRQLAEKNLISEDWGGKTITIPLSAKTGEGVDRLLEMLILEAELLELKSSPNLRARGVVVEGKLSPGQGPMATILVKNGTLKNGDVVLSGMHYGRVKAMINDRGRRIDNAPPSTPVEILGLSGVPEAGDEFFVVKDEKKARTLSMLKQEERRIGELKGSQRMSLEDLYKHIKDGTLKELRVIIKGDVQGSIEALKNSFEELSTDEVKVNVSHMGTGNINESDVMLALVSSAIVIGFNVKVEPKAEEIAKKEIVDIKLYGIIYEAVADVRAALEGLLEPIMKEMFVGRAQVRQVFQVSKIGTVAGCYVLKGVIPRTGSVRLIRNKEEIYKGKIRSLKHIKDDVKEAREGFECGISLEGNNNVKSGDIIESYRIDKITRRLDDK